MFCEARGHNGLKPCCYWVELFSSMKPEKVDVHLETSLDPTSTCCFFSSKPFTVVAPADAVASSDIIIQSQQLLKVVEQPYSTSCPLLKPPPRPLEMNDDGRIHSICMFTLHPAGLL